MKTESDCPFFWDDELEGLSAQATAVLGEEAVFAAIERALMQLRRTRPEDVTLATLFAAFNDALKAELRRLVRPH